MPLLDEIFQAIASNDLAAVQSLTQGKRDVLFECKHGLTPAHYAALKGKNTILTFLCDRQNFPPQTKKSVPLITSAKAENGWTLMHAAAAGGNREAMLMLYKNFSIAYSVQAFDGETPLHIAADHGQINTIHFLVAKIAGKRKYPKTTDMRTPMHYAAIRANLNALRALSTSFSYEDVDKFNQTPLDILRNFHPDNPEVQQFLQGFSIEDARTFFETYRSRSTFEKEQALIDGGITTQPDEQIPATATTSTMSTRLPTAPALRDRHLFIHNFII